ncbi:hypothetical protein CHU98_g11805 [Xylaria longipes]|nr:hypothetical protein CHU98_g11805 [Xylaria longipes]
MGRLHSKGKGISASALPYSRAPPSWSKATPASVEENIIKLARKGATPSQIGVVLRDSHGIAQVKAVTGNKILRILKSNGLAPELPEDLYSKYIFRKTSSPASFSGTIVTASGLGRAVSSVASIEVKESALDLHPAVSVRKHLERNRKDKDAKFHLILIESRIHRLARYYKTVGVLPPTWKYASATASTIVA